MKTEQIQTVLRWVGDWPWWVCLGAALLAGAAAFLLYRRDAVPPGLSRLGLPLLRALAAALLVLMLAGPELQHRKVIGNLSRLYLLVDGSDSMNLSDRALEPGRKVRLAKALGLIRESDSSFMLADVAAELGWVGRTVAGMLREMEVTTASQGTAKAGALIAPLTKEVTAALDALEPVSRNLPGWDSNRVARARTELVQPLEEFEGRPLNAVGDMGRLATDLGKWLPVLNRLRDECDQALLASMANPEARELRAALERLDTLPRWERLRMALMGGGPGKSLARELARKHALELVVMNGAEARSVWSSAAAATPPPERIPNAPFGDATDLSVGLQYVVKQGEGSERGAVVILSDGRQNSGPPAQEAAKVLAERGWPVHTVVFGSTTPPRDISVDAVAVPSNVFAEDRLRGEIALGDALPPGLPFQLVVRQGKRVVWSKDLVSEGSGARKIPFDVAVKELVDAVVEGRTGGVERVGLPIELTAAIQPIEADMEKANNERSFRFRAVSEKRRILLVDGRSRWETRYIRNLFERDEQWEVTTAVAGTDPATPGFTRGKRRTDLPSDLRDWESFDLVIFGDVPSGLWKAGELETVRDFVGRRGGALIFIDGARNHLRGYGGTALEPLLPVEWKNVMGRSGLKSIQLTPGGSALAAFALATEGNAEVWAKLVPPFWASGATVLPGAETLAEFTSLEGNTPAIVYRPFGAGKVLYHAFDESWRWRYEVADLYHVRYWNQIANYIAELPFAVRDRYVALDSGSISYQPGEKADVRVRLRNAEGRAITDAALTAIVWRDGLQVATLQLDPDESGVYRGRTAELESGNYEVSLASAGVPEGQLQARTSFKVEPVQTRERTELSANEPLMSALAKTAGGRCLVEESIGELATILEPLSEGRVEESHTDLWQSPWMLGLLIALLTVEWIWRKRVGMF